MTNKIDRDDFFKKLAQRQQEKYSNDEARIDPSNYLKILRSSLPYTPKEEQPLTEYLKELQMRMQIQMEQNFKIHVDGPKGPWYSHRRPEGCFMCEDRNLYVFLLNVLKYLDDKYPNMTF